MKKFLLTYLSVIIVFSFTTEVLAANNITPCSAKISKQVIFLGDEPTPAPAPTPAPEPKPY